jgi:hypothetical protein
MRRSRGGKAHLEDVEIAGVMMCLGGDGALGARIPDDDVGVGADGDDALSRIEVEDLGGVGARDGDETRRVHYPIVDTLVPHNGHAVLDAVHAVRDLGEVILAQCLLLAVERTVVASRHLQCVPTRSYAIVSLNFFHGRRAVTHELLLTSCYSRTVLHAKTTFHFLIYTRHSLPLRMN